MIESLIIESRHFRIFGFSSLEVVLTFLLVVLFLWYRRVKMQNIPYQALKCIYVILILGITVHLYYEVNTQLNYLLGLSCPPKYNSLTGIFPCD